MKKLVFYRCPHCGNVVVKTVDSGVAVVCCGQPMEELSAHTTDTGVEKHLPVVSRGCKISSQECSLRVQVGSVEHPMTPEHYIQFICLETEHGLHLKSLEPSDAPRAEFSTPGERPIAVYEYCKLHGLWKREL